MNQANMPRMFAAPRHKIYIRKTLGQTEIGIGGRCASRVSRLLGFLLHATHLVLHSGQSINAIVVVSPVQSRR